VELLGRTGEALDIGAGAGRDTAYLLRQGFHVTAVDPEPSSARAMRKMPQQRWLRFVQVPAQDFKPESYDLVNAQYVLPFVPRKAFAPTVRRLVAAVRPGGVMTATFFGPHDSWNQPGSEQTFITRARARALLRGLQIVELEEEDEDGETADGTQKHWHLFHVLARRPTAG
jgi:SAM-dependent methyltransferase